MQPVSMILIYVLIWWVLFFMALPIGLRGSGVNADTGAPKIPYLRAKAIWVSLIALVVTAATVSFLILFGDSFYIWAQTGVWR